MNKHYFQTVIAQDEHLTNILIWKEGKRTMVSGALVSAERCDFIALIERGKVEEVFVTHDKGDAIAKRLECGLNQVWLSFENDTQFALPVKKFIKRITRLLPRGEYGFGNDWIVNFSENDVQMVGTYENRVFAVRVPVGSKGSAYPNQYTTTYLLPEHQAAYDNDQLDDTQMHATIMHTFANLYMI